ncbi:MAG: hypothetical protein HQ475_11765 [SAR202 cluster bacterium]|nr:hypothetical protein [SAR202 cluster bacterium]
MGYTDGPHDDPADTKDRLTRIGSKYQASPTGVADGDNVYLLVDSAGRLVTKNQYEAATFKVIDAVAITAGTPVTVWTPASGKTVRLLGWAISTSAAAALEFQDSGTPGTVIAQTPLLALAGVHDSPDIGDGLALAAVDNTLKLNVTASSTVSGMVFGVEE